MTLTFSTITNGDRLYRGSDDNMRTRADHLTYLRRCADDWRKLPASTASMKASYEAQADDVTRIADEFAQGN